MARDSSNANVSAPGGSAVQSAHPSLVPLGHVAGNITFVREHIDFAIIGIVALSLTPVAFEVYKGRKEAREHPDEVASEAPADV